MATIQADVAPGSGEKGGRPEKAALVETYAKLIRSSKSLYLADYLGLTVAEVSELRNQCREQSITFRVVKNRLLRRAAVEAGHPELGEHLTGPIAVAASEDDEVAPAKLLATFAKGHELPKLRGALVDGTVYSAEDAEGLAKLPSLNELRAQILQLLSGPATNIVRVLAAPGTQLVRVLDARREQLETK